MAKGTLLANAKTTKKSGSIASLKSGKSAIISEPAAAPATKKVKTSSKTSAAQPSSDDVVQVDKDGNERRKLRVNDAKYNKHHRMIVKESLEGMELRALP